jgi:hypothetical protein
MLRKERADEIFEENDKATNKLVNKIYCLVEKALAFLSSTFHSNLRNDYEIKYNCCKLV